MNKGKQYALNKLFNFCIVLGLFLVYLSIELFIESKIAGAIGCGVAALFFIVIPAIFTPYCYAFDSEGISLCYVFFSVERYLWKNIHAIEVEDKNSDSGADFFTLFFTTVFSIKGKNVGKKRFYMKGHIRKSFRTKYLLEKYWDGTITGYFFEDIKNWFDKRKTKKQLQSKTYVIDEVIPMEREMEDKTRDWLKPFTAQAKQYDLDIKVNYCYITEDFNELDYRPKENYTYTLVAEIAHFNEKDESRIVVVDVDLVYVRLGKTAYRGVINRKAQEELQFTFSDVLKEINKKGIEAYCNE